MSVISRKLGAFATAAMVIASNANALAASATQKGNLDEARRDAFVERCIATAAQVAGLQVIIDNSTHTSINFYVNGKAAGSINMRDDTQRLSTDSFLDVEKAQIYSAYTLCERLNNSTDLNPDTVMIPVPMEPFKKVPSTTSIQVPVASKR
jgi:hypothetical protein